VTVLYRYRSLEWHHLRVARILGTVFLLLTGLWGASFLVFGVGRQWPNEGSLLFKITRRSPSQQREAVARNRAENERNWRLVRRTWPLALATCVCGMALYVVTS